MKEEEWLRRENVRDWEPKKRWCSKQNHSIRAQERVREEKSPAIRHPLLSPPIHFFFLPTYIQTTISTHLSSSCRTPCFSQCTLTWARLIVPVESHYLPAQLLTPHTHTHEITHSQRGGEKGVRVDLGDGRGRWRVGVLGELNAWMVSSLNSSHYFSPVLYYT